MTNIISLDRARRIRALQRAISFMDRNEIYLEYPTAMAMSAWLSTEASLLFEPYTPVELPCDTEPAPCA